MAIERRNFPVTELRAATKAGKPVMTGRAAVFSSPSSIMRGTTTDGKEFVFREVIMPGAFRAALGKSDPRALFNHDPNLILGRSSAKTLRLQEDGDGLPFEIDPPDTSYARDLQVSMSRGDVRECSFGFTVADKGDKWEKGGDGVYTRTILEDGIDELYDVSPVTYPAYPETDCAVRSLEKTGIIATPSVELADYEMELRRRRVEMEAVMCGQEVRVNMGYAGYNSLGACKMCGLDGCLCPDCPNKARNNMQTSDNGGCCTATLKPGCLCLGCANTDQCKMMQMYSM